MHVVWFVCLGWCECTQYDSSVSVDLHVCRKLCPSFGCLSLLIWSCISSDLHMSIGMNFRRMIPFQDALYKLGSFKRIGMHHQYNTIYNGTMQQINSMRFFSNLLHDLTDDLSPLFPVKAGCRKASSHYPYQCEPSYLTPYCGTRGQWWVIDST